MLFRSLRVRVVAVVVLTLIPSLALFSALDGTGAGSGLTGVVFGLLSASALAVVIAWFSTGVLISRPAERNEKLLNDELEAHVARRSAALLRSNQRLATSRTELRRLSRELLETVERERTRLSREVHDQIGQALTGIKMDVVAAHQRLAASDVAGADQRLATAIDLVDDAVQVVRRIAMDLRPPLLDDFGLTAAVEWQMQEFERRAGIPVKLTAEVDEGLVRSPLGTAAFRILEESLTNIVRHAEAPAVEVRLATTTTHLTLTVHDHGRGITDQERAAQRSLGLIGMRERTLQLGGQLTIAGQPGQGTTVLLVLPLETPDIEEGADDD